MPSSHKGSPSLDTYGNHAGRTTLSHRGSRAHLRQGTRDSDVQMPYVLRQSTSSHSRRRVQPSLDLREKGSPSDMHDGSSTRGLTPDPRRSPTDTSEQAQQLTFAVSLVHRLRIRLDEWKTGGAVRRLLLACLAEFAGNVLVALPAGMTVLSSFFSGDYPTQDATARLSVALAILIGVLFALVCTQPVAGATLHPSFTIVGAIFGILPYWKVPFFIFSQITGFFLGRMLGAWIYWDLLHAAQEAVIASGRRNTIFTHGGLAGLFTHFQIKDRHFGYVVLGELACSFVAAVVVCSCFDASNPFVTPSSAPFIVACAYAVFILGWSASSLVGSPAVDLGGRLACWAVFGDGKRCFPTQFTIHAALTPTIGTLAGFVWFLLFLGDSRRPVASATLAAVHEALAEEARHAAERDHHSTDGDNVYFEPLPLPRTCTERYTSFDPPPRTIDVRWQPRTFQQPSVMYPPRSPTSPRAAIHASPTPLIRAPWSAGTPASPRKRISGFGGAPSPLLRSFRFSGTPSPTRAQEWDRGTFGGSAEAIPALPPVPRITEDVELTPRPREPQVHPPQDAALMHDGFANVQAATIDSTCGVGAAMVALSVDDQPPPTPSSATHEGASLSPLTVARQSENRFAVGEI